jgi:hypothetical protein
MTSHTITTMPHSQPPSFQSAMMPHRTGTRFAGIMRTSTGRSMRALHIVVSRCGKSARAMSTRGNNMRLAIWLPGWRIEIYDEFDDRLEAPNQIVQPLVEVAGAMGAPVGQSLPDPALESTPSGITRTRLRAAGVVPRWLTRC